MLNKLVETRRMLALLLLLITTILTATTTELRREDNPFYTPPAVSPDGSLIALYGGTIVQVHDAVSNQFLFALEGHTDLVTKIAWSPDGNKIATSSVDQTVRIWDASNGTLLHVLSGHLATVSALAWHPDGTHLVSSGFDSNPSLFLWDTALATLITSYEGGDAHDMAFSPDGQKLALSYYLWIAILDTQTFQVIATTPQIPCCSNPMWMLSWAPDGNSIVAGSINGWVTIWDASSGSQIQQFTANPYHQPDSRDNTATLQLSWVRDVAFAADGAHVRSISGDGTLRSWDTTTGQLIEDVQLPSANRHAAFSSDGTRLVTIAESDGAAQLFAAPIADAGPDGNCCYSTATDTGCNKNEVRKAA